MKQQIKIFTALLLALTTMPVLADDLKNIDQTQTLRIWAERQFCAKGTRLKEFSCKNGISCNSYKDNFIKDKEHADYEAFIQANYLLKKACSDNSDSLLRHFSAISAGWVQGHGTQIKNVVCEKGYDHPTTGDDKNFRCEKPTTVQAQQNEKPLTTGDEGTYKKAGYDPAAESKKNEAKKAQQTKSTTMPVLADTSTTKGVKAGDKGCKNEAVVVSDGKCSCEKAAKEHQKTWILNQADYKKYDNYIAYNPNTGDCVEWITISGISNGVAKCEHYGVKYGPDGNNTHPGQCFLIANENSRTPIRALIKTYNDNYNTLNNSPSRLIYNKKTNQGTIITLTNDTALAARWVNGSTNGQSQPSVNAIISGYKTICRKNSYDNENEKVEYDFEPLNAGNYTQYVCVEKSRIKKSQQQTTKSGTGNSGNSGSGNGSVNGNDANKQCDPSDKRLSQTKNSLNAPPKNGSIVKYDSKYDECVKSAKQTWKNNCTSILKQFIKNNSINSGNVAPKATEDPLKEDGQIILKCTLCGEPNTYYDSQNKQCRQTTSGNNNNTTPTGSNGRTTTVQQSTQQKPQNEDVDCNSAEVQAEITAINAAPATPGSSITYTADFEKCLNDAIGAWKERAKEEISKVNGESLSAAPSTDRTTGIKTITANIGQCADGSEPKNNNCPKPQQKNKETQQQTKQPDQTTTVVVPPVEKTKEVIDVQPGTSQQGQITQEQPKEDSAQEHSCNPKTEIWDEEQGKCIQREEGLTKLTVNSALNPGKKEVGDYQISVPNKDLCKSDEAQAEIAHIKDETANMKPDIPLTIYKEYEVCLDGLWENWSKKCAELSVSTDKTFVAEKTKDEENQTWWCKEKDICKDRELIEKLTEIAGKNSVPVGYIFTYPKKYEQCNDLQKALKAFPDLCNESVEKLGGTAGYPESADTDNKSISCLIEKCTETDKTPNENGTACVQKDQKNDDDEKKDTLSTVFDDIIKAFEDKVKTLKEKKCTTEAK